MCTNTLFHVILLIPLSLEASYTSSVNCARFPIVVYTSRPIQTLCKLQSLKFGQILAFSCLVTYVAIFYITDYYKLTY